MNRKFLYSLIIFLVLPVLVFAKADVQKVAATHLDKIVAVVNSDVITQNELAKRITMINKQLAMSNAAAPQAAIIRKQALDGLIDNLLQLQLAQRSGIQISDAELGSIISNVAKNNNLTVDQLKKTLQEQEGLSFKKYREQLREQLLINRVTQQFLGRDIVVADEEITKVLRNPPKVSHAVARYHVVDILIGVSDKATADQIKAATSMATQIMAKLKQGVDATKIVQEYNVAGQKVSSNDLGWRKVEELPTIFAPEVIKINAGQIVGPLQAPNGVHLLKLLEAQGSSPQAAKFTKEQAQDLVYRQKLEQKLKPWLEELREKAYIKIMISY